MAEKTLNTRIQLKFDTLSNWSNVGTAGKGGNLVLKKGEIAICEIPSGGTAVAGDDTRPEYMLKVGDGATAFKDLKWIHALAADVYDWAKAATKPEYSASEVSDLARVATTGSYNDLEDKPTIPTASENVHLVKGPVTDTTLGTWTGTIDGLTAYYEGLVVIYVPHVAGANTTTLDVNGLGAKKCIRQATSNLTTQYGTGTAILMTYRPDLDGGNGAWQAIADYDSTDVSSLRPNYARYYTGDYPLYQYKICVIDAKERIQPLSLENTTAATKTQNPIAFKPDMLYYFNTNGTTAANSIVSAQSIYYATYSPYGTYTFNSTVPAYHTIYLVGSFDSATGLFTLDQTYKTSWYKFVPYNSTFTKNEDYFEEGKYYIYVGRSYSTNNYYNVEIYNPMYYFDGHNLVLTNTAAERTNDILGGKVTNQVYENLSIAQNQSILSTDGENYAQKIRLKEIVGKTKPINQLYDHSAWSSLTDRGVDITNFDDGHFTLNGQATGSHYTTLCNVSITAGHVYLLYRGNDEVVDAGDNTAFLQLYGGSGNYAQIKNNATFAGVIWTAVNNYAAGVVRVRINEGTVYTNYYVKIKVVDLTMVYGAGNEPTEVDAVLSDNPWILAINEAIPSELYSSVISGIRVNGVNLWNEEWEVGTFNANTGAKGASSQRIRSANFIKVMPNTYYFGVSAHPLTVYKYDKNKNYIGYVAGSNRAILTDPNCWYVNIALGSSSDPIQTYDNTTALVIGNTARPYGPYHAPWEFMLPAPETLGSNDTIRFSSQTDGTWNVEKVESTVSRVLMTGSTEPDIATLIELNGSVEIVGNTNEYLVDPDLAVISSIHVGDFGSDDTNQTVKVGTTTFGANDAVELVAGDNVTLIPDTTNKTITISTESSSGDTYLYSYLNVDQNKPCYNSGTTWHWGYYVSGAEIPFTPDTFKPIMLKKIKYNNVVYANGTCRGVAIESKTNHNKAVRFDILIDSVWRTVALAIFTNNPNPSTSHTRYEYHVLMSYDTEWDLMDCNEVGIVLIDISLDGDIQLSGNTEIYIEIPEEPVVDIITFAISGVNYSAANGMTWGEWLISKYNTSSIAFSWPNTTIAAITATGGDYLYNTNYEEQTLATLIESGELYLIE